MEVVYDVKFKQVQFGIKGTSGTDKCLKCSFESRSEASK